MEEPILRQENSSKSKPYCNSIRYYYDRTMIYDFKHLCKNYNKNIYKPELFSTTACPKCGAIGQFALHGCYSRYVVYFKEKKLIYSQIEIKRIKCKPCKTTHAILPIDIIAYRLLSLLVFLFIINSFYIEETPITKIANNIGHSYQFINSVLYSFKKYIHRMHVFFCQTVSQTAVINTCPVSLLKIILSFKPLVAFQYNYISKNKKPCFMCKYFDESRGPPAGTIPL